jgi:hypothetical protein
MHQPAVGLGALGAIISAVSALVSLLLRARGREKLAAIHGASQDDKARLVADAVAMFNIPVEGLSPQQRYDLVVKQLEDRNEQRKRTFLLTLALMSILAVMTGVIALSDKPVNTTAVPGPKLDNANVTVAPRGAGADGANAPGGGGGSVSSALPRDITREPAVPRTPKVTRERTPQVGAARPSAAPTAGTEIDVNFQNAAIGAGSQVSAGNVSGKSAGPVTTKVHGEGANIGSGAKVNVGNVNQ